MRYPSYIGANLISEAQNAVAALETIYNAHTVDPDKAAAVTVQVAIAPAVSSTTPAVTSEVTGLYAGFVGLYNAIPLLVSDVTGVDPSIGSGLLSLARGLGSAMDPADAVAAFALAADTAANPPTPLPAWTANRVIDNANAAVLSRLTRAVFLAPYVEGLVAQTYRTRADAITAKADCVGRFDRELELCGLSDDIDFAASLVAMRDAAVDFLAQVIINSRPVLMVSTPVYIPALLAAWRIYADPLRADELIARNDVKTAEFMPTTFEAQAA
jgi:prophage DNA circulation protein